MIKTINAYKLRTNLGEYLNEVYYKGNEVIVERHGQPVVKIVQIASIIADDNVDRTEKEEKIIQLNKIAGCVSLDMNLSPKQLKKIIMRQYDEEMLS